MHRSCRSRARLGTLPACGGSGRGRGSGQARAQGEAVARGAPGEQHPGDAGRCRGGGREQGEFSRDGDQFGREQREAEPVGADRAVPGDRRGGGGAVLSIAATGRLTRWLPASPRRAPTAAAVAGFAAVGADALGLALLAAALATTPGRLAPLPAAAATAASLTRLLLARRAAHRCLAIRASLT